MYLLAVRLYFERVINTCLRFFFWLNDKNKEYNLLNFTKHACPNINGHVYRYKQNVCVYIYNTDYIHKYMLVTNVIIETTFSIDYITQDTKRLFYPKGKMISKGHRTKKKFFFSSNLNTYVCMAVECFFFASRPYI